MSVNIDGNEFIFSNENASGGFSVPLILQKMGGDTLNKTGGYNVKEGLNLFEETTAVPSWLLTLNGGNSNGHTKYEDTETDEEIEDELHDKLLKLATVSKNKNRPTRKITKKRKNKQTKKRKI